MDSASGPPIDVQGHEEVSVHALQEMGFNIGFMPPPHEWIVPLVRPVEDFLSQTLQDLQNAVGLRFDNANKQVYYEPEDIRINTIAAFNTSATTTTGYSTSFGVPTGRYRAPANTQDCIQVYGGQCALLTNYIRGPVFFRTDLSLVKRTRFSETKNFELRGEFLNAFNNINFFGTTCASSSQSYGQITSAYTNPNQQQDLGGRLIQLVLRINF